MGSLNKGQCPLPQDLRVTVLTSSTLRPSAPATTERRRAMFLSNIDQVLNFTFETVHFFTANPEFPAPVVVERLQSALERVLVPYDFLAGRLRVDAGGTCRLEIDCNDAGARFVVAESELELAEVVGGFEYPNPAFRQLVLAEGTTDGLELHERPLIAFQVTSFRCGGFAMGVSVNHAAFDGISFQLFLKNLAAIAAGKPLPIPPHTDRRLLAARSPPRITFPHPELVHLESPAAHPPSAFLDADDDDKLEFHLFRLSAADISALKDKARAAGAAATSFNAVTAHLWRCKALAAGVSGGVVDPDKPSTVLYAVDIRPRLRPPLPAAYTGNAVLSAYASATWRELESGPFAGLVEAVAEGAARMDGEYARSVIDWGEVKKGGFPRGDVFVSSWWRLGFGEVEYPWGTAAYTWPVADLSRDIVLLLPAVGGGGKGVNALVALPADGMKRFEELFNKFIA